MINGDFNVIFDETKDSINRNQSKQEKEVVHLVTQIMTKFKLIDLFRHHNSFGGFTWGRDNPSFLRSRLDHTLVSANLADMSIGSTVTCYPNESDHNLVYSEISLDQISYGPGIVRVNATILDDPDTKTRVLQKLEQEMSNVPLDWSAHMKLDYAKIKLREYMLREGKVKARLHKSNLEFTQKELTALSTKLDKKLTTCMKHSPSCRICLVDIDKLKIAIESVKRDFEVLKTIEANKLIFRSKCKWAEEGEKSTKYFLNLLKVRQQAMLIRKITSNVTTFTKQDEISKAISNFYKNLYTKQPEISKMEKDDKLFKDLPELNEIDKAKLNKPLTLEDITNTLNTCKESAPGPDGLSYRTLSGTWQIMGPLIFNAWNHSCKIGQTSQSQKVAVISLLEKKGKDKRLIENLRPISLSNCDIKLCTKSLALKVNEVLPSILSSTQTGYIKGRQVNDNSRLLEEIIELYKSANKTGYLITLDAQKAFDSVDHVYLLNILKCLGFPNYFATRLRLFTRIYQPL